jgi:hypothetical protein
MKLWNTIRCVDDDDVDDLARVRFVVIFPPNEKQFQDTVFRSPPQRRPLEPSASQRHGDGWEVQLTKEQEAYTRSSHRLHCAHRPLELFHLYARDGMFQLSELVLLSFNAP